MESKMARDIEKQKIQKHESYLRNREKVRQATILAREKRAKTIAEIKEGSPCMDCGVYYPHYVMDYYHRDPNTKYKSVATLLSRSSMEVIMLEISKCDLVCSNCHRERTW